MNARPPILRRSEGYALITVLVFAAIGAFILSATMRRTMNVSKLNERERQYTVNLSAAEADTEKVVSRMIADFRRDGVGGLANGLSGYRTNIPNESSFWTNFQFTDAQGNVGRTYVSVISNWNFVPLDSQYYGLMGYAAKYRIISNVKNLQGPEKVIVANQQEVQPAQIPIFQFAIFWNDLLEFTWAAPLTVRGRVHANGEIYTGSASDLSFNSAVTSTSNIVKKAWAGYSLSAMTGAINYNSTKSTNVPTLSLPIGTNNLPATVREIIKMPPSGESFTGAMGTNRYYNKAEMVILVSNSTVTAEIRQVNGFDPTPTVVTWWTTNAAYVTSIPNFLNLTNSFNDAREGKTVRATQIDVGKYSQWTSTNSWVANKLGSGSNGTNKVPNILYVADFRTNTSTSMNAVRLTNGYALPARGLTVATPNPLYTYGNYNCPNDSYRNTTNTTQSMPASLISDAWTCLSPWWKDTNSLAALNSRVATNTTVNAAIISGMVYSDHSDGVPFSGGAMNMPRLLEHWGNGGAVKLTLNTSIVNLYNSTIATNVWQTPGTYYYAPTRDFNFDQNYTDMSKLPPGTPMLTTLIRGRWSNPPPNTTSYAGY